MEHYSNSSVSTYRDCMYKYDTLYRRKVRIVQDKNERMDAGTAFHKAINLLFTGNAEHEVYQKMAKWASYFIREGEYNVMLASLLTRGLMEKHLEELKDSNMVNQYTEYHDVAYYHSLIQEIVPLAIREYERLLKMGWALYILPDGTPCSELLLEVQMAEGKDWHFKGYIDCVLVNELGMPVLVDFKLRATNVSTDAQHDFDRQTALYQLAFQMVHGIPLGAACIYQVVQATIRPPEITKKGTVSRHKIVCDYDTYLKAIVDNGENPDDYADMLAYYANKKFYDMHIEYRDTPTLKQNWQEFISNVEVIEHTDSTLAIYPRNFGYRCKSCNIATFCMTEYNHMPTDHLVQFEENK